MVILARVRTGAHPLMYGYVEGQGVIPDPLSEGGATPPWPDSENVCRPSQGECQDPIRGGGGGRGRGKPSMPPQVRRTHPPLCGILQPVAEGGIPWEAAEDPPPRMEH